jgi:hypothetical protein
MKKHQFYKKTVSIGILNIGILNAFQEFRLLTRAARISPNSVADTYPAIVTGYLSTFNKIFDRTKWSDGQKPHEIR